MGDKKYTLQVAVEDCTGCELCVEVCPVEDEERRQPQGDQHGAAAAAARAEARQLELLPRPRPSSTARRSPSTQVKDIQLLQPLFEFSGACAGCGETPYIKLMTQLFGDRAIIANATGCSSIYGGNLPTTPYAKNAEGRGPAWSNSLFEDNAEFGLGMRLCLDKQNEYARELLTAVRRRSLGTNWSQALLAADQSTEAGIEAQRERVRLLKDKLAVLEPAANGIGRSMRDLAASPTALVKKSVWILGGDGWAYDIGYGGLDHVMASRPERQHPGARHRGLFQHRRPDVQGDAARRRGQVRRRRQDRRPRRTWA